MKITSVHGRFTTQHEHWIMEKGTTRIIKCMDASIWELLRESMDKNEVTNDSYDSYAVAGETIVNVMNARIYVKSEC